VAGAFRGYGCPQGFFAQESLVDEIAERLGMDPLEFHRRNAIRLGDIDRLSAQLGEGKEGLPRVIRSCGLPECMESGAKAIGWQSGERSAGETACPTNADTGLAEVAQAVPPASHDRKRGMGMACTMQGSGIAGIDWASAFLKMNEDGSFFLQSGASDVGGGADTVLAQIAAETLGVSLDKIVITSGDTDVTPFDVGAYASSTTIISGGAVKKAAEKVRAQVLAIAARMLDAPVESLACAGNEVFTAGADHRSATMTEIAMRALYQEKVQIMDGASHFNTDSPPPFCANFAEVEVDTGTGVVHVLHLATAVDPGTAVNPMQAEGQVEGAVTQGLGFALTEELLLDQAGRPLNPNFLDYKIFSAKDMPKLTTILVETDEPLGPFGAKSISEVPINGVAPAIANAIYNAVGVRIRKLPIRPEDVLRALAEREKDEVPITK
jgi:putative selenate reductase molybdopterin-binding subunit